MIKTSVIFCVSASLLLHAKSEEFRKISMIDKSTGLAHLKNCEVIEKGEHDGDSFWIRTAEGVEHHIRLFHVDCAETDPKAEQISLQRNKFGCASDSEVIALGKKATELRRSLTVGQKFSVYTRFNKAGGWRNDRIRAFVVLNDGTMLGERLLKAGLAMPGSYPSNLPDGYRSGKWKEHLRISFERSRRVRPIERDISAINQRPVWLNPPAYVSKLTEEERERSWGAEYVKKFGSDAWAKLCDEHWESRTEIAKSECLRANQPE